MCPECDVALLEGESLVPAAARGRRPKNSTRVCEHLVEFCGVKSVRTHRRTDIEWDGGYACPQHAEELQQLFAAVLRGLLSVKVKGERRLRFEA